MSRQPDSSAVGFLMREASGARSSRLSSPASRKGRLEGAENEMESSVPQLCPSWETQAGQTGAEGPGRPQRGLAGFPLPAVETA